MIAELVEGCAGLLDTAGAGVYDTNRTWTDDDTETCIVIRDLPQTPSKVIALTAYAVVSDPVFNDTTVALQVRFRGDDDPLAQAADVDTVIAALNGLHDTTVGGVPVVLSEWVSTIPGPQDANKRWETTVNFHLQVTDPTNYRTD